MLMNINIVMNLIDEELVCKVGAVEKQYESGKAALSELADCAIERITARDGKVMVIFSENKIVKNDLNADWVKRQIEETGIEPGMD